MQIGTETNTYYGYVSLNDYHKMKGLTITHHNKDLSWQDGRFTPNKQKNNECFLTHFAQQGVFVLFQKGSITFKSKEI